MSKINKNYAAFVLDESGSMDVIRAKTIEMFNSVADSVAAGAKDAGIDCRVSLHTFNSYGMGKWVMFNEPAGSVPILDRSSYRPDGGTALLDAVGDTITSLKNLPDANDPNVNFLVVVITDGEENQSRRFRYDLNRLLNEVEKTDRWTIVFNVPPKGSTYLNKSFGIPLANIREWEATNKGMNDTATANVAAVANYYSGTKSGLTRSTNFYVDVNLRNLSTEEIKKKLTNVTNNFKQATVTEHISVKEFVEQHIKRNYRIGSTYYCLTKPETIQPNKKVLIMEKNQKTIWGGDAARQMIGLPVGGSDAKVKIEDLAKYDVYVQSTSVNRKLIPSTKILVDLTLTDDLQHTW